MAFETLGVISRHATQAGGWTTAWTASLNVLDEHVAVRRSGRMRAELLRR